MLTSFWAASTPACGLPLLSWESDSTTFTSGRLSFLSVSSMWSIPILAAWFQACPEIAGSPVRPERMPYFSVKAGFSPWPEAGGPATSSAPTAASGRTIQMRLVMSVLLSVDRVAIVYAAVVTAPAWLQDVELLEHPLHLLLLSLGQIRAALPGGADRIPWSLEAYFISWMPLPPSR